MATSGIINGTNLGLYIKNGASFEMIGYSTACSITVTHDTRATTNSTSGGWQTRMAGDRDWEMSVDSFVAMEANTLNLTSKNWYQMATSYILNRTPLVVVLGNEVVGDYRFEGQAFLTSLEMNGSNEESATYSLSFIAAGELYVINNSVI